VKRLVLYLALLSWPVLLPAQLITNSTATPLGRGLMLERNGAFADAATQYALVLAAEPSNVDAVVGMSHVLPKLGRRADLFAVVAHALAADSSRIAVLRAAVRTYAMNGAPDSARKYADRWATRESGDEAPYSDWSEAALEARDVAQARLALDLGRTRLGPGALGVERAELMQNSGDMAGAVAEWIPVLRTNPPFRDGAVSALAQTPAALRPTLGTALRQDGSAMAQSVLGWLQIRWGDVTGGVALVRASLPADSVAARATLRQLYQDLRARPDAASHLAAAQVLEALAAEQSGPGATSVLVEAARAYAEAGDEINARRVLALMAKDPAAAGLQGGNSATVVGMLASEGKAADAERMLASLGDKVDADLREGLTRRIAMAWVRQSNFARAEELVAGDSSIAGFDLRGRIRLYRGDLAGANDLLKQAGAFDETPDHGVHRVTLLVLIQTVAKDSSAALGNALLALEQGDSARAVSALASLASTLNPVGAATAELLAGQVAIAQRDTATAIPLLQLASAPAVPGTAATAQLELARIDAASGRGTEADQRLERLILAYPESAVIPEARRMRDGLRHVDGAH
jgi:hypothetical protein